MEERALWEGCIRGDPVAWDELIRRFQGVMAAAASTALKRARGRADPADVQDVCQSVLASLWSEERRRLRSFRGGASLGTWLAVISARTALNHVRSASRKEGKRFARLAPVQATPKDSIKEYLEQLPPRRRAVVALRYYEGMRTREIAEVLGIKLASVTSILGRAIRDLGRLAARPILR